MSELGDFLSWFYTADLALDRLVDFTSEGKIHEFMESLDNFHLRINLGINVHTAVVSLQVSDKIDAMCKFLADCMSLCS